MTGPTRLLIKDADVLDGLGSRAYRRNVVVVAGQIERVDAKITDIEAGCDVRVVDGTGRVLCPGFIDVHSHDDSAVLADPSMLFKTTQGVTSVVTGNCGIGLAPHSPALAGMLAGELHAILGYPTPAPLATFGNYLDLLEATPCAVNRIGLVPHGALRLAAMSEPDRAATAGEIDHMCGMLAESLHDGAAGMSTGLVYHPGRAATSPELSALCRVLADHHMPYVSHIRDEGTGLLDSVAEILTLGRTTGCAVHVSHLKAIGHNGMPRMQRALDVLEQAAEDGVSVTFDVYPYTSGSTAIEPALRAARSSATTRRAVRIVSAPELPDLEGRYLVDVAAEWGVSEELAVARISQQDGSVTAVIEMMEPETVRAAISSPLAMIGSDGLPNPRGRTHPRLYGTFPRVLRRYVEPEGPLSMAEAIRRMTSLPASRFCAAERGVVRPGAAADLVLFDPATVRDMATDERPDVPAEGIDMVMVNGELVRFQGRQGAGRAGEVIRLRPR